MQGACSNGILQWLTKKKGKEKVVVTTARKMAKVIYRVLKEKEPCHIEWRDLEERLQLNCVKLTESSVLRYIAELPWCRRTADKWLLMVRYGVGRFN